MAQQEVIFIKDMPGVAHKGEIKKVAPGFARNYLLPRKIAIIVNKKNTAAIEAQKKLIERRILKEKEKLEALAKIIESKSVTIEVAAGPEGGKLFGAVTPGDISAALKSVVPEAAPHLEDKHSIVLKEPIRQPGTHTATVVLSPHGVKAELKVWVIEKK